MVLKIIVTVYKTDSSLIKYGIFSLNANTFSVLMAVSLPATARLTAYKKHLYNFLSCG